MENGKPSGESAVSVKDETVGVILRRWNPYELLLFLVIIPLIMVIIYFLPTAVKHSYFILYSNSTSISSLYLSNFTHSEPAHIGANLVVYYLALFLLFNIETDKRTFRIMMAFSFLMLPWIISLASVGTIRNLPPSQGVSGIVAAMLGYLVFAIYQSLGNDYHVDVNMSFPMLIFMVNALFLIVTINGGLYFMAVAVGFLVVLGVLNARGIIATASELMRRMDRIKGLKTSKNKQALIRTYRLSVVVFSFILLFSLITLVPKNPVVGTMLTNSVAHYIGYVLGLFVPYLIAGAPRQSPDR